MRERFLYFPYNPQYAPMAPIPVPFVKMSGAGNDFVLIDNMDMRFQLDAALLARSLCDRHLGIGADGLILLEPSTQADFQMLYYNADGSHGGMCGNGGRCASVLAHRKGYSQSQFTFEALGHIYSGEIDGRRVAMRMKDPSGFRDGIAVEVAQQPPRIGYFLDTGAPHAVFFVEQVEHVQVAPIGRLLREHSIFAPDGANVNFVEALALDRLRMRTYERGVEAETLACGTGAIASALTASRIRGLKPPIAVETRSGETLGVSFDLGTYTNVILEGPAMIIFIGDILVDNISCEIVDVQNEGGG